MKKIKNTKFYDLFWYMFGSMAYGFTSLIYMIIITRVIGIEAAGKFSFAFAVAATFYVLGVYFGRTFQVTDTSNRYSDTDYLFNRLTTCILMLIFTIVFCLINKYNLYKFLLIILLTIYRAIDALLDSIHAIIQKKDKLAKIGLLTFYRTVLLITIFLIFSIMTKNLLFTIISIIVIDIIFVLLFDYRIAKKNIEYTKFDNVKNFTLLIEGFSVFIFSFLAIYILNSSKYAIDSLANDVSQGIFGILIMPSSFLSLVNLYLTQPFLKDITLCIKNNKYKDLIKLTLKIVGYIIFIGVAVIFIGYFFGIPVLNLLYDINLYEYKTHLIIILIASILYSLYSLISTILVAMRKNLLQVISLLFTSIFALIICNSFVENNGIDGAVLAFLLVMLVQLIIYIFIFIYSIIKQKNNIRKKIAIRLMGGLGNQMFQYAELRRMSIKNNSIGIIDLKGITNKTHNVYGLNHCNISKEIIITNNMFNFKGTICYLLYGFYWVLFFKNNFGKKLYQYIQPALNNYGIYCVPDGYIQLNNIQSNTNYMVGYFQDYEYNKEYKKELRNELQIIDKLSGRNKKIYSEISKNTSVCVHIRRGDYVGSLFEVCSKEYYYEGINIIRNHVENPYFYIFSDDIEWVKKNMKFDGKVTYVDWKNNQYEDLKLMSNCKHFIMSNSSFSYWAQFLSENENKLVIAPSKWYNNGKSGGLYDDDWTIINVDKLKKG